MGAAKPDRHLGPRPPDRPANPTSRMPVVPEAVWPWLATALVVAVANLALLAGDRDQLLEQVVLWLALAASVAGAGLVAARSTQAESARDREERERPTEVQLQKPRPPVSATAYLTGMQCWAGAVQELLHHAIGRLDDLGTDDPRRAALCSAADDTDDLLELLHDAEGDLGLNDRATLRSVCTLWEAGQSHAEALAASVDPGWHRRWEARAVVARRLRHGQLDDRALDLPYRS